MPSNDSSAAKGLSLGAECATCGHSLNWHMGQGDRTKVLKCDAASGECGCSGFASEPKGSGSSSPDDECAKCGHWRDSHDQGENHCRVCHAQANVGEAACGHTFVPDTPCRCGHPRAGHSTGPCLGEVLVAMGTDRENCRCRAFAPAGPDGPEPRCEGCGHTDAEGCGCPPPGLYEPECSHEAYEKFSSTAKCADCGHTWSVKPPAAGETAGEPEAHEHDWTEWGAVYHGGHFQWRDCRACGNTESRMEGHFCPECAPVCKAPNGCHTPRACKDSCAFEDQLRGIRLAPRPEDPEDDHDWQPGPDGLGRVCRACGLPHCQWSGGPCIEPEAPCPCIREGGCCHAPGVCLHGCAEAADEVTRLGEEMEPEAHELRLADLGRLGPRPPYAVAYATGSGVLNEIALPGDVTAAVMDGALVISHPSGVLGIVHVKPWEGP